MAASSEIVTKTTNVTTPKISMPFGAGATLPRKISQNYLIRPDTSLFGFNINPSSAGIMDAVKDRASHPHSTLERFVSKHKIPHPKEHETYSENFLVLLNTAITYLSQEIKDQTIQIQLLALLFGVSIIDTNRDEIISRCLPTFLNEWKPHILALRIELKSFFTSEKDIIQEVDNLLLKINRKFISVPFIGETEHADEVEVISVASKTTELGKHIMMLNKVNNNIKDYASSIKLALSVYHQIYLLLSFDNEKKLFIEKTIACCEHIENLSICNVETEDPKELLTYFSDTHEKYQSETGRKYFEAIIFITIYAEKLITILNDTGMKISKEINNVSSLGLGYTRIPEIFKEIKKLPETSSELNEMINSFLKLTTSINLACNQFRKMPSSANLVDIEKGIKFRVEQALLVKPTHEDTETLKKYQQDIADAAAHIVSSCIDLDFTLFTFQTALTYLSHGYTHDKTLDANIRASFKKDEGVTFINALTATLIKNSAYRKVMMDAICDAKINKRDNQVIFDKLYQHIIEGIDSSRKPEAIARSKYAWHITLHQSDVNAREELHLAAIQGSDAKGFVLEWEKHLQERDQRLAINPASTGGTTISSPMPVSLQPTSKRSSSFFDSVTSYLPSLPSFNGSVYTGEDDDFQPVRQPS